VNFYRQSAPVPSAKGGQATKRGTAGHRQDSQRLVVR